MTRAGGRRRFRILAVAAGLAVPLLLGEVAVRLFSDVGTVTPESMRRLYLPYESATFSRQVFAQRVQEVDYHFRGAWYRCRIDAQGYRGPDFEPVKPKGVQRVIVYGGSSVFDLGANEGEDWPRRLEVRLRQQGLPRVEVLNAGVPGTSASDAFGRLFAEGHALAPDVVVLYAGWNDLAGLDTDRTLLRRRPPYFPQNDPRLTYQGPLDRALCASQLYVRLRWRYWNWRIDAGPEGHRAQAAPEPAVRVDPGRSQFEVAVRMFVALAREIGATPVLVKQARLVAADNTDEQRALINYRPTGLDHDGLVSALARTDAIVDAATRSEEVLLVDASARMTGDATYFQDHVHTTAEGSAKLAEVVAEALAPLLR